MLLENKISARELAARFEFLSLISTVLLNQTLFKLYLNLFVLVMLLCFVNKGLGGRAKVLPLVLVNRPWAAALFYVLSSSRVQGH